MTTVATPASEAASATAITEAGAVCLLPPFAGPAALDLPEDGGCGGSGCSRERLICGGGGGVVCCLLAATAIPWARETTAGGGPSGIMGVVAAVTGAGVPPLPLTAIPSIGLPTSSTSSVEFRGGSS